MLGNDSRWYMYIVLMTTPSPFHSPVYLKSHFKVSGSYFIYFSVTHIETFIKLAFKNDSGSDGFCDQITLKATIHRKFRSHH